MNIRKTALTFALIAALSITAYAQNASDFKTDGKGTITGYTGTDTVIVIPSKIGNETIKAIGEKAFYKKGLTSVTIPNSVKFIYDWAFKFNILTSITIGANVELVKSDVAEFSDTLDRYFDYTYNIGGKLAGTYTRPNAESEKWTRH